MSAYTTLERRFARISALHDAAGILDWDSQTMMPDGAAPGRAEQLATLQVLAHEQMTAPDTADLLDEAAGSSLGDWQQANLREMRRQWVHAAAVPAELVEASSKAVSACERVWRQARLASDFAMLRPSLEEVLRLKRQIAAAKAASLGCSPYDALLDEYEPGGKSARIDALFDDLASFLPELLGRVTEHQAKRPPIVPPQGPFGVPTQRELGLRFMQAVGFDFQRGRLDISAHPFCGGAAGDVRITTRYNEDDFTQSLMGVLHETGHALYEQNRPADWMLQPVGQARGMSLHESQSLIVEMQAARTRAFLTFAAPILREAFVAQGPAWDVDNLVRLYTRVEPGFIRVDADEVTYPAHVILRTRLEKAMVAGDLMIADLPGAWNEGMQSLLGIVPPDDRRGCLQDIHWPSGGWGYFPTYTLGAMTAAQLFDAAKRADGEVEPAIARGDFSPLMNWLKANIHSQASRYSADELLTRATGRPLDVRIYKAHLERRYLADA